MSVSFAPALADDIKDAADRESTTVSAWLADAARVKLRNEALGEAIREWEARFGPITEEARERARATLREARLLKYTEETD